MDSGAAQAVLMYFVLPVWLAAGFADYLCHRASSIQSTRGWRESLLHLLESGAAAAVPMCVALRVWVVGGFGDCLSRRGLSSQAARGGTESLLHLVQFRQNEIPTPAEFFLDKNMITSANTTKSILYGDAAA